jgi:hypothetical protein
VAKRLILQGAAFLLGYCLVGGGLADVTRAAETAPSLVPENGEVAISDPAFVQECKATFADAAEKLDWHFGDFVLTRSEKWGLIWRIDFVVGRKPNEAKTVYRAICWRPPHSDGIATATFFDSIKPL